MIGIGEISSTISLAKDSIQLLNYFRKIGLKYFHKKSLPLDKFYDQAIEVICSSLYAPPNDNSINYYSLVKQMNNEEGEQVTIPIGSGFNVTGVRDAFALTKIAIALIERKCVISLATDTINEQLRKENLCLIGGHNSNLIARDLYRDYIPNKFHFYSSEGGMNIHGRNFHGGTYGHILFMSNPWNNRKKIIWVAGLGPAGTGAAVDFLIESFHDKAPAELNKLDEWVLFIKGNIKNGRITEVVQLGHYTLS